MHHKKELQELMRTYSSMKALQLLVALADDIHSRHLLTFV